MIASPASVLSRRRASCAISTAPSSNPAPPRARNPAAPPSAADLTSWAYADEVKSAELGVSDGVLAREGAVCDEVAVQMAQEVRRRFRTDVGIAITGIAGPGGGSPGKPVGTVHIAVALGNEHTVERFVFEGDRDRVREMSCDAALGMLKHFLDRI